MGDKIIHIYGPDETTVYSHENKVIQVTESPQIQVVRVVEAGRQGIPGPPGQDGEGVLFFRISDSLYGTTSSLALADISSSLIPITGSSWVGFDLGSTTHPWRSLYLSGSLSFQGSDSVVSINSGSVSIGSTLITSDSIQINSGSLIIRNSGSGYPLEIYQNDLLAMSINSSGLLTLGQINTSINPISGSILYSGSNFYLST